MNKFFLVTVGFFAIGTAYVGHHFWKAAREFKYFSADCSIFDRSGKVVFHSPEEHCE